MLGDLNANIVQYQNPRSQQVADLLMEFGLVDLLHHFWQCWRFHHMKTWSHVLRCKLLRTRCDYILVTYQRQFLMVGIKDVRNYSSDNSALRVIILQRPMRCHGSYLQGRCVFPLSLPEPEDFRPVDRKFQDLKAPEPTPPNCPPLPQWMSETSTRLIDERTAHQCNPQHNRNMERKLTKVIWRPLLVDCRRQAEKATEDIVACLEPAMGNPDLRETYAVLKRWYLHASTRAPNPSQADMANVTGDYDEMYRQEEPPSPTGDWCLPTSKPSGSMTMYPQRGR